MNATMPRPNFVTDEMLEYLDTLRETGITNMLGAGPYVANAFPELQGRQPGQVVTYWMKTFGERHAS